MADDIENFYHTQNQSLEQFYDAVLTSVDLLPPHRYTDEELLAVGSIKEVYKATDNFCSREVAIARIKQGIFSVANAHDFIREVQITASLEHPNIISIYDVGITDGRPWFTMELTTGKTLEDLPLENLSLAERLDFFIQICDAVCYAHNRDILHLDLKPNNITIGTHGQITLCDWGIASSTAYAPASDLTKGHTFHGYFKGSPGFMAPEQATVGYQKSSSSDIFGLGAILYFLFTGEAPFRGSSTEEIILNTQQGKITKTHTHKIPERLVPVIHKALSTNPAHRYSTAAALQSEIESYRNGFATYAENATISTQAKLFFVRNKRESIAGISFLTILALTTLYYIVSLKQSESVAIASENEVKQALIQLQLEQREKLQANTQLSKFFILNNRLNLNSFDSNKALNAARNAVEKSPNNKQAVMQLGFTHFSRQEFKDAAKFMTVSESPEVQDLMKIADEYAKIDRQLTGLETVELFRKITKKRMNLKCYMLQYDSKIKSRAEHSQLVAYMLGLVNEKEQLNFKYNAKSKALDLSNNPSLRKLRYSPGSLIEEFNLIDSLPVKKLILQDTGLKQSELEGIEPIPTVVW